MFLMVFIFLFQTMWKTAITARQQSWLSLRNKFSLLGKNYSQTHSKLQHLKVAPSSTQSDFQEGREIEGFTVQQVCDVPEFQLKAIRLLHEDTGAQYLHLQRDDSNNVFSINLRTTPFDSTGVPHILEHTTLCGSKKYPCRDPFFKMLNRSLATFMNALTGPDYTLYPFATLNNKDYYNLMSVYMDAVFNPQLKELDFKQEGWRLEHENVDDPNSPIIFKGVVFNEMKGSLTDNQRVFGETLMNKILPSHTYGVISGGDPLDIPQLTYEQLKDFHSQYYHPSNARFYSYGNFPLKNNLKFLSENYLQKYGKVTNKYSDLTKVPSEPRWTSGKEEHIHGKVDSMAATPEKQSTLAVSYLCSDINDLNETFVLQFLSQLLVSGPNSSFYKSLVEPNIGSGFSPVTGYEGQIKDTLFAVGLLGLNPKDFGWVVETCDKTINDVIKEGFDQKRIDAILHSIELNTKHQSSDFGLRCLFNLVSLWNHDGDIVGALKVDEMTKTFKDTISKNPRYLQEKVDQYFKQNNHKLTLKMTPDDQYEQKKLLLEKSLLETKLSTLTPKAKTKVYEDGLKLREAQDAPQDTECLPSLKINDLKKDVECDELGHVNFSGVPVQVNVQSTNHITYVRGLLNASHLTKDVKAFLPLFTSVATKMGTKNYDYQKFDQLAQLKTGGLSMSLQVTENKNNTNSYEDGVLFSSYALDYNVENMFNLWEELFNNLSIKDRSRLETLMKSGAANMVSSLADHGHLYAMSASAALVNPAALRSEQNGGLSYVRWLCNIVQQNKYDEALNSLQDISKSILNKKSLRMAVNLSSEHQSEIESKVGSFIDSISGSFENTFKFVTENTVENESKPCVHYDTPLPVSYTSKSIPTVCYTHQDYAPLRILCRLLSSKYLLPTVREKGGAYGAGARLSQSGVISFFSYRDPKPAQTFKTFDTSLDWIMKKNFSEQDVEEAKLGTFQSVDAPVAPGARGMRNFLYGISEEEFKKHRLQLMKVTQEDLMEVASKYLNLNTCEGRVLLGPSNQEVSQREGEKWQTEKL